MKKQNNPKYNPQSSNGKKIFYKKSSKPNMVKRRDFNDKDRADNRNKSELSNKTNKKQIAAAKSFKEYNRELRNMVHNQNKPNYKNYNNVDNYEKNESTNEKYTRRQEKKYLQKLRRNENKQLKIEITNNCNNSFNNGNTKANKNNTSNNNFITKDYNSNRNDNIKSKNNTNINNHNDSNNNNNYKTNNNSVFTNSVFVKTFNKEINSIINQITPTPYQLKLRQNIFSKIKTAIERITRYKVELYGSTSTSLCLANSDIDITILTSYYDSELGTVVNLNINEQQVISQIVSLLNREHMIQHNTLQVIRYCRVPLIKYQDRETGVAVDITVNQNNGITSLNFVNKILNEIPIIKNSVLFFKLFLRQYDYNDASTGGLSSFMIFHMVLMFYYHEKIKQIKNEEDEDNCSSSNVGKFVLSFLIFYGYKFDNLTYGIKTDDLINWKYLNSLPSSISFKYSINENNGNNSNVLNSDKFNLQEILNKQSDDANSTNSHSSKKSSEYSTSSNSNHKNNITEENKNENNSESNCNQSNISINRNKEKDLDLNNDNNSDKSENNDINETENIDINNISDTEDNYFNNNKDDNDDNIDTINTLLPKIFNVNSLNKKDIFYIKQYQFPNCKENGISIQNLTDSKLDVGASGRNYDDIKKLFIYTLKRLESNYITMRSVNNNNTKLLKSILRNDNKMNLTI